MKRPNISLMRSMIAVGAQPVEEFVRDAGQGVSEKIQRWVVIFSGGTPMPPIVIDIIGKGNNVDAVILEINRIMKLLKKHTVLLSGPVRNNVLYRIECRVNQVSSCISQREFILPEEEEHIHEKLSLAYLQYPWYPGDDEEERGSKET